ncbi:ribosomal protein S18-alanine N-acetyltransferase [Streptococcus moroccensis]|uniref:[Ribosomal protein bS18]-alanine N-acetyltransferase n=1 Tax=Streptococcus moroccensis TaxID=1451356 RepID=A0ABT9YSC3_9STRE|nr:ribosomal protein S18-alanine N-acetyltransferase [Streptococcus moroccensis]MDQ0222893.1 ribosomal-protein-alanine N-acetyltransferase [Streptococcus moroccensis]
MPILNGSSLTASDVHEILEAVYGVSPWTLEQIEADLERAETTYFALAEADKVIGFLAIQDLAGELEMTQLAVIPEWQGKGYGQQLLGALKDRPEAIFLEVRASNQPAISLYKKHGFEEVGRRQAYYHNPTEDALLMTRAERKKQNEKRE